MPVIYGMYLWDVSLPGSEVISIAGVTMLDGGCDDFFDFLLQLYRVWHVSF